MIHAFTPFGELIEEGWMMSGFSAGQRRLIGKLEKSAMPPARDQRWLFHTPPTSLTCAAISSLRAQRAIQPIWVASSHSLLATTHNWRIYGVPLRHRRPSECRQIHAFQRADRDCCSAGGQQSLL